MPTEVTVEWQQHIVVDPRICHGQPCFKGTRVLVSVVLDHLAAGQSSVEVQADFPTLGADAVPAALAFAAHLARGGWIEFPRGAA